MIVEMDLSIFRQMLLDDSGSDLSNDLVKFDNKECVFYYDESNNTRKLWLDKDDFNAPIDRDFTLGGVMHFGKSCNARVDALKRELQLQKSVKEIKFKHISKSNDFWGCLAEERVNLFLQWLNESDLYVHCSNVNTLYWAIIDIIDSINEPAYIPFNRLMKNELYRIARSNYGEFYRLLHQYDYPNIAPEKTFSFYQRLIDFIDRRNGELSFEVELLRQGLKDAHKQSELPFLQGNQQKTVIDSFFPFYIRPIGIFPYAQHFFDHEDQIEKQFGESILFQEREKAKDFCFVDSKAHQFVQLSDCVVGLFGKYYAFINNTSLPEVRQLLEDISAMQRSTLARFAQVVHKSEKLSKLLFNSVESNDEHDLSAYLLEWGMK